MEKEEIRSVVVISGGWGDLEKDVEVVEDQEEGGSKGAEVVEKEEEEGTASIESHSPHNPTRGHNQRMNPHRKYCQRHNWNMCWCIKRKDVEVSRAREEINRM